jgi:hypothetical protein
LAVARRFRPAQVLVALLAVEAIAAAVTVELVAGGALRRADRRA